MKPSSNYLLSEPAIVAGLLAVESKSSFSELDWANLVADYDR